MKQVCIVALAFCLLLSCRKDHGKPGEGHNPPPAAKIRIKTITSNGITNTYVYDSLDRLLRSNYGNGQIALTDYTYTDTTVADTNSWRDGSREAVQMELFRVGANGLATSEKYVVGPTVPSIIYTFTYNSAKQLVEQTVGEEGTPPVSRTVYFYSNGNMDSCKIYNLLTNQQDGGSYFEYYTDQQNTLGNENNGISWLGVGNANLVKKEIEVEDGATIVNEYTYEFDGQKRAVKSHQTKDGTPFVDKTYTYY